MDFSNAELWLEILIKVVVEVGLLFYIMLAVLTFKQVLLLNRALKTSVAPLLNLFSFLHILMILVVAGIVAFA